MSRPPRTTPHLPSAGGGAKLVRPQGTATALPPAPRPPAAFHPRNRHQGHYDFPRLLSAHPPLAAFMTATPAGEPTIAFSDPRAVRALNWALLADYYGIQGWDLPEGFLCPPIPGRADYLHQLADLLALDAGAGIPCGPEIAVLDVGVGANCIYPLIGHHEYGWRFVGCDINPLALAAADRILVANPTAREAITLRRQPDPQRILAGIIGPCEQFDLTMCNPPFHDSPEAARAATTRKWRNLARSAARPARRPPTADALNFGGQGAELWCPGGEAAFVRRMIDESRTLANRCLWFTTLLSKADNLPAVDRALAAAGVVEAREFPMAQGQKQSRIVAWTFHGTAARQAWARRRWIGTGAPSRLPAKPAG